jgi:hypothetical protein
LQGDFTYMVLLAEDPRYLGGHNFYQMRITFLVRPNKLSFGVGKDSDEVKFVDPAVFESSDVATERKIFEYCQLAKNR